MQHFHSGVVYSIKVSKRKFPDNVIKQSKLSFNKTNADELPEQSCQIKQIQTGTIDLLEKQKRKK